ncbi:MAG: DNA polymerase domain-containing protein [Solirubrobacteraceae bacterium]
MADHTIIEAAGREVRISNPDKVFFAECGITKLDLVHYYLGLAEPVINHLRDRPTVLKRYVNGAAEKPFFQKRVPESAPDWLLTATVTFPSGRSARELLPNDPAHLVWALNLGVIDWNPWPVRNPDLDHPDELRVDLDPTPQASWDDVRRVALVVHGVLEDHGLTGFPKTSGSRGIHVNVRIEPQQDFDAVRRAALALAREVERRAPDLATSKWWKEERHGVFVDYNQNARDRTTASAYSVRPTPDARVSTPLNWDEVPECDPAAFTIDSVPARFAQLGDPGAGIDDAVGSLEALLELAARDEAAGLPDAPDPGAVPVPAPGKAVGPTGRRRTNAPLIEIARAATQAEALQGLERWKSRHSDVAAHLEAADVLVDSMRGRSTTWTRIRLNLRHVPEADRPAQEALEVDFNPWQV